jgi:hypothetical protein
MKLLAARDQQRLATYASLGMAALIRADSWAKAASAERNLSLPETGAAVGDCAVTYSYPYSCRVDSSSDGRDQLIIVFEPMDQFDSAFYARVELTNISGVGFRTTASRTQVRFPRYRVFGDPRSIRWAEPGEATSTSLPRDVSVDYTIAEADKYEWASPAPGVVTSKGPDGQFDVRSLWRYSNESVPSPVVGVCQDVLDENSRKTFIAGIWVGIAAPWSLC